MPQALTTTTSSTLEQQITVGQARLAPAGDDAVAKSLRSLQAAGMGIKPSIAASEVNAVYSYALANLSGAALAIVVRKLIRGEYDIDRKQFVPVPPELAAMVRAEQRVIVDDLARARQTLEAIKGRTVDPDEGTPQDPAAKERVKDLLAGFRQSHKSAKEAARGNYTTEEVSPEKAAMWSKIMDLPDAKEISKEQEFYRTSVAKKIANN